jgi:hypothetical protein
MIKKEMAIGIIKTEEIKIIEQMEEIDKGTNIETKKVEKEVIRKTSNLMNHPISGNFIQMIHSFILMSLEKKILLMISKYICS